MHFNFLDKIYTCLYKKILRNCFYLITSYLEDRRRKELQEEEREEKVTCVLSFFPPFLPSLLSI